MGPSTCVETNHCPIRRILAISDVAFAIAAPFAALFIRNLFEGGYGGGGETLVVYSVSSAITSLVILTSTGSSRATWRYFSSGDALRAGWAIALGVAIGVLIAFAHNRLNGIARAVPLIQVLVQVGAFVGFRLLLRSLSRADRSAAGKAKQVLVVGCNKTALTYLHAVRELSRGSIEVAGLLAESRAMVGQTVHGKRVLGTIAEATEVIATLQVHGIDIWKLASAPAEKGFSAAESQAVGTAAERFALPVIDVEAVVSAFASPRGEAGEATAVSATESTTWKPLYSFVKRSIDLAGASLLLLAALPLMS